MPPLPTMGPCYLAAFAVVGNIQIVTKLDCEIEQLDRALVDDVWPEGSECPGLACLSASVIGLISELPSRTNRIFGLDALEENIGPGFSSYMCPCMMEIPWVCSCDRYRDLEAYLLQNDGRTSVRGNASRVSELVSRATADASQARAFIQKRIKLLTAERAYVCKSCDGCCDIGLNQIYDGSASPPAQTGA